MRYREKCSWIHSPLEFNAVNNFQFRHYSGHNSLSSRQSRYKITILISNIIFNFSLSLSLVTRECNPCTEFEIFYVVPQQHVWKKEKKKTENCQPLSVSSFVFVNTIHIVFEVSPVIRFRQQQQKESRENLFELDSEHISLILSALHLFIFHKYKKENSEEKRQRRKGRRRKKNLMRTFEFNLEVPLFHLMSCGFALSEWRSWLKGNTQIHFVKHKSD